MGTRYTAECQSRKFARRNCTRRVPQHPTNVEFAVLKRLYAYATSEVDRLVEEEEQQLCGEKVKIYNIHKVPTGSRRGEGQAEDIPGAQISDDQAYIANKKAVIERDTDLLTKDEIEKHREEVTAATVAELLTWNKHGCFSRKPKRQARNIVDCKWVIKWKHEMLPDGTTRRIIRARLTIRGFKDREAADLERYAGTLLSKTARK